MKNSGMKLLFAFAFVVINFSTKGQNEDVGFAINPKFGFYYNANSNGPMGGGELNLTKNKLIYSVDYYYFEEFDLGAHTPDEYFNQVGLMIGSFKGDDLFRFQYQGGIGAFWGLQRTEIINESAVIWPLGQDYYNSEGFVTLGLELKVGLKVIPWDFMSFGIDLQTNINAERFVVMPMFSVEIGRLK